MGPYSLPPALGPAAIGRLTDGAAGAAGAAFDRGAAAGGAGRASGTAVIAGAGGAEGTPGGSSSAVYSRERRPEAQVSSTSTSINGSATARLDVIFRIDCPLGRRSIAMRAPVNAALYWRLAAR